jgi:hypothetical protein
MERCLSGLLPDVDSGTRLMFTVMFTVPPRLTILFVSSIDALLIVLLCSFLCMELVSGTCTQGSTCQSLKQHHGMHHGCSRLEDQC